MSTHSLGGHKKHGFAPARGHEHLYSIWMGMRNRCNNKPGYKGIRFVCSEWDNYVAFREWSLANGYAPHLTIDRIDNNGNYEPGNCRWATNEVNTNNTARVIKVTAFGETKAIYEWLKDSRCAAERKFNIIHRMKDGWTPEDAISIPLGRTRYVNRKAVKK